MEERVRGIHDALVDLHGEVERSERSDGVRQLVTTILSQNVADTNTRRAAESLRERYDGYEEVESAPTQELADVISVAGLPETKAERIQRALSRVRDETGGEYTLSFLDDMPDEEAKDWLTDIKGVGPKTAGVVLSFRFGKPVIAVDTHVERVSKRFGLVPESATNERAHEVLEVGVPDGLKHSLHVLMVRHGREYCTARNPDCDNRVCREYCDCEGC